MHNFIGHLRTINRHKWLVMKFCFRLGLYRQGLCHDLSKYSWIEFSTGVKFFQGDRSPNGYERERYGFSAAWLHHKGRNRHHWEYWTELTHGKCIPIRMPVRYVVEMFCDRVAATMVYEKKQYRCDSALHYFLKNYDFVLIEQGTKDLLEMMLRHLSTHPMAETFSWIRTTVLTEGYVLLEDQKNQ